LISVQKMEDSSTIKLGLKVELKAKKAKEEARHPQQEDEKMEIDDDLDNKVP